ncbi:hypothetical protein D9613_008591 [Agrocybe pediades]|uniref:MYND-type domain-containing protein n=1 Tax=Agrocybe pediades TaxID=84607 RepID=A0A8H4VQD2_9AGAR|nr:hypothetical protein D9613_008591 [Agrocybe pediades]
MPGPGSRAKKSKGHKSNASTAWGPQQTNDAVYIAEIDNAEGWNMVVDILCDSFKLPDLTTRSGLKKVHANFNDIFNRIDKVYQRNLDNFKFRGAIVGIYTKMCVDSLLRNKLFDKGILDMIIPLLDVDDTRHMALRFLGTITHHGGAKVRIEIAKHSAVLCKLIRAFPDDDKVVELSVITLAHAIWAVVEGDSKPANPAVLKAIDLVDVLKTLLDVVKRPYPRFKVIFDHAIEVLTNAPLHGSSAFKAYPASIRFLVAGLRCKDWVTRSACLAGLINLYVVEAEEDERLHDPMALISAFQRGVPGHLQDIMMDYGLMRCDTYLTLQCTNEFQKAMMQCGRDHDFYALGKKQAELILKTEFSVADGCFEAVDPVTGRKTVDSLGMPFTMWSDSLPHGAKAIRKANKPGEEDLADFLDIKWLIMKQRVPDAVFLAKKSIERNPEQAYFYYAITLSADPAQCLKAAKKGLKCKQITPFVKYQLLQRGVYNAGEMGIRMLRENPDVGDTKWEEGIAFLMSALDDAKAYLDGAPPDNRHIKNICYWYVLLSMLVKEDISPDLRELKVNLDKLKTAEEFSTVFGTPTPKTYLRLAQQAAVKHYAAAIKEYSRPFNEYELAKGRVAETPSAVKLEDDLEAWLEKMTLEDGTEEHNGPCGAAPHAHSKKVDYNNVTLYRCSWCGNPSAALKKCSGCTKTRYCDHACQKAHWAAHKKVCKNSA